MKNREKKFGILLSIVFAVFGVYYSSRQHVIFSVVFIELGLVFLILAFKEPATLKRPVIFWLKFGEVIQKITTPFVLAILFVTVFIPIGLLMKILKKDSMNLKFEKNLQSYWKTESENLQSSFQTQF